MLRTYVPDTLTIWAATSRFMKPCVGTAKDVQGLAVATDHHSSVLQYKFECRHAFDISAQQHKDNSNDGVVFMGGRPHDVWQILS